MCTSNMSSIKKSKSKKKRVRGYQPLVQPQNFTGRVEAAKDKLQKTREYRDLKLSDLNNTAMDITDKDRLKVWFATPQDQATPHQSLDQEGDNGRGTQAAAAAAAAGAGGVQHKWVSVKLFLAQPQRENRKQTLTGSTIIGTIESQFEDFCSYGINADAALLVGDQYLKWEPSSLVIPRGVKIRDDSHGAQPLSLGDEKPDDLGLSDKLDQLLHLVAEYNGTRLYHAVSTNSKLFVRDALQKLGKNAPSLLVVFEDYHQRIRRARSPDILAEFESHKALDDYFKENRTAIEKKKTNREYFVFLCVCFHVQGKRAAAEARWMCREPDCCLPFLVSGLTIDHLIFKEFWRIFHGGDMFD